MALQPDIWMTLEQWKADNQRWNHRPPWQLDQFSEEPARASRRPDQALAWLGRNLIAVGSWLERRYGDACLIQAEVAAHTTRG